MSWAVWWGETAVLVCAPFRFVKSERFDKSGGALRRAFDDGDFFGGEVVELVDELGGLVGETAVLVCAPFRFVKSERFDKSGYASTLTTRNFPEPLRFREVGWLRFHPHHIPHANQTRLLRGGMDPHTVVAGLGDGA